MCELLDGSRAVGPGRRCVWSALRPSAGVRPGGGRLGEIEVDGCFSIDLPFLGDTGESMGAPGLAEAAFQPLVTPDLAPGVQAPTCSARWDRPLLPLW